MNLLKSWTTPTATDLAVSIIPDGWTEDEGEVVLLEGIHAENNNLRSKVIKTERIITKTYQQSF